MGVDCKYRWRLFSRLFKLATVSRFIFLVPSLVKGGGTGVDCKCRWRLFSRLFKASHDLAFMHKKKPSHKTWLEEAATYSPT